MNKPSHLLLGSLSLLSVTGCKTLPTEQVSLPNVIYVFPDQFRNAAMGFWSEKEFKQHINYQGDPVHTPYLDAFARQSLVLSSAMSNCPLSSPYRGMMLTGMYMDGSGISLNCNSTRPVSSLNEDAECISDVYSKAGYDCAYFGKLHADFPTPNDPEHPGEYVEKGWPVWDAYTPPQRRHGFNYWYSYGTFDVHKQPHYWDTEGKRHEVREWSPLHEAREVVSYLKNEKGLRDNRKPFFIMVGMNPPHSPYQSLRDCMEEDYNLYKDIPIDQLLVRPNADPSMDKARCAPYYFASVTGVDRAFGYILQALKDLKLDEQTIVVFTSDHGETMCSQHTNDPKNSPYSESMNVPFIVRYPRYIQPRVDNLLLSTPDIMPTLLTLSGLSQAIPTEVQGKSYASIFTQGNKAKTERPAGALYFQNTNGEKDANGLIQTYRPNARGIKTARYTLALYIDPKTYQLKNTLFFDDENDPYQMNNLRPEDYPKVFKKLCRIMGKQLKEIGDPWFKERIAEEWLDYK